jgi:hypothetical protein
MSTNLKDVGYRQQSGGPGGLREMPGHEGGLPVIWLAIGANLLLGCWLYYRLSQKIDHLHERIIELYRFKPMLDYLERDLAGADEKPTEAQLRARMGWPD